MIRVRSIRLRMMLLFSAVSGILLAFSFIGFYLMFERVGRDQLDRRLRDTGAPIVADLMVDLALDPDEKDVDALDIPEEYFEVIDPSGKVVQRSRNLKADLPIATKLTDKSSSKAEQLQTLTTPEAGELRVALLPFAAAGGEWLLAVGEPTREIESELSTLRRFALVLFPIALLLTAGVSRIYANRSLRPIADLTAQASAMIRRLPPSPESSHVYAVGSQDEDELRTLASTFNQLFDRMTATSKQLRQFVSDASHELRTPLAVLQGETELLLARPRTATEYEVAARVIDAELKKLSHIVEGLFTLSMADAGQLRVASESLYLEEVLEEACTLAGPSANHRSITIEHDLQKDVLFTGDAAFLRQLFLIFIDNAVKYSPRGSRVRITLRSEKEICVQFQDEGIGIAPEHMDRIFERFYRILQGSYVETQSGGLGLAIAKAIVGAHRGVIECESTVGVGSRFAIRFPQESVVADATPVASIPSME